MTEEKDLHCPGTSSYDCKLGTCHGLPQCGKCCKCLRVCLVEKEGVDPQTIVKSTPKVEGREEVKVVPHIVLPPGSSHEVPNHVMLEAWVGAIVYVKFQGHAPVECKITEVSLTHTKITVTKSNIEEKKFG